MAYVKTVWLQHAVDEPNTFDFQSGDGFLNGKTVTLIANFGSIIQQGTEVSVGNLNKIEQGVFDVTEQVENLNVVDQGTATIPDSGYSDVGTGAKPVWESGNILVAGITILVGNKYDLDIEDSITVDSAKVDAFTGSSIIKFLRVDDNNIKVRLSDTSKLVAGMTITITEVKNGGGVTL